MDLIQQFIMQYTKEIDYYDNVSRLAAQQLQQRLQESGIRAIVTSRAKSPERLKSKLEKRFEEKNYKSISDIYEDIVDLSGVRVALYFPGETTEVDKIIRNQFNLLEDSKEFSGSPSTIDNYNKRFSGYWATHYRVSIKSDFINEQQKHYCDAKIEIQVASVLMHAWSEVEHDLVYKPYQGELSRTEYIILDELNGLVLSGELALERLQSAMEQRIKESGREFANNYELASYLFEIAKGKLDENDPMLGDVDVLFMLLERMKINSPSQLSQYIQGIDFESDRRTVAQQIIDSIIEGDTKNYQLYSNILHFKKKNKTLSNDLQQSVGVFMSKWIELEILLRTFIENKLDSDEHYRVVNSKILRELGLLDSQELSEFDRLRRIRNNLAHGIEIPEPKHLTSAGIAIEKLTETLKNNKTTSHYE